MFSLLAEAGAIVGSESNEWRVQQRVWRRAWDFSGWALWTLQRWGHWHEWDKLQAPPMQRRFTVLLLILWINKQTLLPKDYQAAVAKLAASARADVVLGTPSDPVCFGKSPSWRPLWAQQVRQRRYSKPQKGLQVTAGKLEQGPKSNSFKDLGTRNTPSTADKEKTEETTALRGRQPANFPFNKSSRMHFCPSNCIPLTVTNTEVTAPQFSITFHKVLKNYFYRESFI